MLSPPTSVGLMRLGVKVRPKRPAKSSTHTWLLPSKLLLVNLYCMFGKITPCSAAPPITALLYVPTSESESPSE